MSSSDSSFSNSSSSSGDKVEPGKSSLVFQDPVKNPNQASFLATLDLAVSDRCKVQETALHYVDMTATYAGYSIVVYPVKIEDSARFQLVIVPRRNAASEIAIYSAWKEALLGKVKAAMKDIRDEYAISQCPKCDIRGDQV